MTSWRNLGFYPDDRLAGLKIPRKLIQDIPLRTQVV